MREILFRGKRVDNGEWIEGSLVDDGSKRAFIAIHPSLAFGPIAKDVVGNETLLGFYPFFEVDHDTIGQFTGLTDKNGKRIFEGDIIKAIGIFPVSDNGKITFEKEHSGEVFFYKGAYYFGKHTLCKYSEKQLEVIGNTRDNPELIKK